MTVTKPKGRVNYEPNSWGGEGSESAAKGFQSYPAQEEGTKQRTRSEKFADHYSQARQFYISQTPIEQEHISSALVFELSKVQRVDIRAAIVSHLINIDSDLAKTVATDLRLTEMPSPAKALKATQMDMKPSSALSVVKNGPKNFAGRTVGILITDGVDIPKLNQLVNAIHEEKASVKLIAPQVGGVKGNDGKLIAADEKIGGGPSVLYDAVALLPSKDGAVLIASDPAVRDFIADALAHRKFIAYGEFAKELLEKANPDATHRPQFVLLDQSASIQKFMEKCRSLRFWPE
jgi:catalase